MIHPTSVLATVTGRDRPGVTAAFFAALAAHDVDVRDVEQVVIRDRLTLTVLVDLRGDTVSLTNSVTRAAGALGMECEISVADEFAPTLFAGRGERSHVVILGRPLRPGAVGHIAQGIADAGGNIETVTQLAAEPLSALEMVVRSPDPAHLHAVLLRAARDTGVDVAIEPAALRRRAKRLVALDLDATLTLDHGLEPLAADLGVSRQMAALATRAADGEIDESDALRARVGLLSGLPVARLRAAAERAELPAGVVAFVQTLRGLGYAVGVVSAALGPVVSKLITDLDLDVVAASEFEVADGILTGALREPVVDAQGKADALTRFSDSLGIPLTQAVAVGDGADDLAMLERAGLGIAINASAGLPYIDSVLFVLGVTEQELAAVPR